MNYKEATKLIQHESFVEYAGGKYRFAGLYPKNSIMHKSHLMIFDEPPSLHVDTVLMASCDSVPTAQMIPRSVAFKIADRFFGSDYPMDQKTFDDAAKDLGY